MSVVLANMPTPNFKDIQLGDQVYIAEGSDPIGAVRELRSGMHPELVINVENAGDVAIPLPAVRAVHDRKVVLDVGRLEPSVRTAVGHVRDAEDPNF